MGFFLKKIWKPILQFAIITEYDNYLDHNFITYHIYDSNSLLIYT